MGKETLINTGEREWKNKVETKENHTYSREDTSYKNQVSLTVIMSLVKQVSGEDDAVLDKSKETEAPVNSSSMNIDFLGAVEGIFTTLKLPVKYIKTPWENFRLLEYT